MPFRFAGPITMNNASASLATCVASIDAGEADFSLESLTHSDSSAVGVLIAARRHAESKGKALRFMGMPGAVSDLARLYGVDTLIGDQVGASASLHDS